MAVSVSRKMDRNRITTAATAPRICRGSGAHFVQLPCPSSVKPGAHESHRGPSASSAHSGCTCRVMRRDAPALDRARPVVARLDTLVLTRAFTQRTPLNSHVDTPDNGASEPRARKNVPPACSAPDTFRATDDGSKLLAGSAPGKAAYTCSTARIIAVMSAVY